MVEDGRGVSGDSAGVLSVLVPDREHYGPERNLVPAATFCLGGPVTTLTSGDPVKLTDSRFPVRLTPCQTD
jgi:hypothetical protein